MAVSLAKLSDAPKVDNLAKLHVYVSPNVAAYLGWPTPESAPRSNVADRPDYSDGYGGTYAVGE